VENLLPVKARQVKNLSSQELEKAIAFFDIEKLLQNNPPDKIRGIIFFANNYKILLGN